MNRNLYNITQPEMLTILGMRESSLEELAKEFPDMHPMEIRTVFDEYWQDHTARWGSCIDLVRDYKVDHGADLFTTVYWLKAQLSKSDTFRYLKDEFGDH